MSMECSITRERQSFIRQLKRNPFSLLQHVPTLAAIALQRYARQRNRKIHPRWLPKKLAEADAANLKMNAICQRLPVRENLSSQTKRLYASPRNHSTTTLANDPEDYLAKHRFRELIDFTNIPKDASLPQSVQKWLDHPPAKSDSAWETYSTSERVANLLTYITLIPLDKRHALPVKIAAFLHESMHWIFNNLEYYRKATNNHILNNARALIMCGVALSHQQAIDCGIEILKRMLLILIQPQGALRERSTHYQLIILTWVLDAYSFLKAKHHPKTGLLLETIMRMREVAAAFSTDDGYLQALIGDISPDVSPKMTATRLLICYPEFWPKQSQLNLTSKTSSERYDDYYFLYHKQHKLILNCPEGHFPRQHPTHAHNDLTSFVWLYRDKAILIDCGRARYCKDPISSQQKSALSHNVALVNGFPPCSESFVIQGNWWPSPYAYNHFAICAAAGRFAITHHGFQRATKVGSHTRYIYFDDNDVLNIEDTFHGKEDKNKAETKRDQTIDIKILWQLDPMFHMVENQMNSLLGDHMRLKFSSNEGNIQIETGFCSTQYGEIKKHLVLIFTWRVQLPFTAKIKFEVKSLCAV